MKKILGLDIGSDSIGWAIISENGNDSQILGMGSRIIPYNGTEGDEFAKGTGESRNILRTQNRIQRKGYDRYQLRRQKLTDILIKHNMFPTDAEKALDKLSLWELRSKAVTEQISPAELGRLLLWLNQKRGYKSARTDNVQEKKDTQYVSDVKNRHQQLLDKNLTIGQYFYEELKKDPYYRIKNNVYPREAYKEEFDAIFNNQQKYHPNLTNDLKDEIKEETIYYQRKLKSFKGLVSKCEFERRTVAKGGKTYFVGPYVAPKSSPLFKWCKIWENINNISLSEKIITKELNSEDIPNKRSKKIVKWKEYEISQEHKLAIFEYLNFNEKLTYKDLFEILKISSKNFIINKQFKSGITGNTTYSKISKALDGKYPELLTIDLSSFIKNIDNVECYLFDRNTGEVLITENRKEIDPKIEISTPYMLWHTIYSISDMEECSMTLQNKFNIDKETANKLSAIDFTKEGYGNRSAKVIRRTLPYLMDGYKYSESMCLAGYDNSNTLSKSEAEQRVLVDKLNLLPKNSLRQPIVEKILNQMIHTVNAIIDKYGKPDEILVELSRELKQGKEERNLTDIGIKKSERERENIIKTLNENGIIPTRNNILKYRLYSEIDKDDKKLNACCIYCGQPISFTDTMIGNEVDIEHIIPTSLIFDDSRSNKTLAHRKCNSNKNNLTAYDFMRSKSAEELENYVERVNNLHKALLISKTKKDKLLASHQDYLIRKEKKKETEFDILLWESFIDKQLRESQFITRKTREILFSLCRNVTTTTGEITSKLRSLWGYDDITMNLQMPKYREAGLTTIVEYKTDHGKRKHKKEVITSWNRKNDHRQHAIDALVVAGTKQEFIRIINTLSSEETKSLLQEETSKLSVATAKKLSLLDKNLLINRLFTPDQVKAKVAEILISFKAGKKVAVWGSRKSGSKGNKEVVQRGIIIPRGPLSEESVYGKIRQIDYKQPIKYIFTNPELIVNSEIKTAVLERLSKFVDTPKKTKLKQAIDSLKREPIYLDSDNSIILENADCFREEIVIKYTVDVNFNKVDKVVDEGVKRVLKQRLEKFNNKPKEAFKDVKIGEKVIKWYEDENLERPIISVRCATGLKTNVIIPIRKDESGKDISFVLPKNNHHLAIYRNNTDDCYTETMCTFWHAVERKKNGLPVIIKNANEIWEQIENGNTNYSDSFIQQLPKKDSGELQFYFEQNKMYIVGLSDNEYNDAIKLKNYTLLSNYLYKVQKVSITGYKIVFRHHLETSSDIVPTENKTKKFIGVSSIDALISLNPKKVTINYLGEISI